MADIAIASDATAVPSHPPAAATQPQDKKGQDDKKDSSAASSVKQIASRPTYISDSNVSQESTLPHQVLARKDTIDLDDYFTGPRNPDKHSKWPPFMRVHGSVVPRMIVPLVFMACWSTLITCISVWVHNLGISSILLTVLGFVVGLALSLRSSTAYERYSEGRKLWAQLLQSSRTLARIIWVHTTEGEGEQGKEDLLAKLSGINLIVAFAIALKHKLRFEPDVAYEDLAGLIGHLDTFAKAAHDADLSPTSKPGTLKAVGSYLSLPFAMSNPRKAIKRSKKPLGNLPLEILTHLSIYVDHISVNASMPLPVYQGQAATSLASMDEVMTQMDRVLNTPLPVAYTILISQISWVYVLVLPFQLFRELRWITIPGSILATYIIIGLASICAEIENPFGNDVNDLPLDLFCQQLAADLDIMTSSPCPKPEEFINRSDNMVLYPLSKGNCASWKERNMEDIRGALKAKATIAPATLTAGTRNQVLEKRGETMDSV